MTNEHQKIKNAINPLQFLNFQPLNDTELIRTLNLIYPNLHADSAHLAILHSFQQFAITDGGDDQLADYDINFICIYLAQFITPKHIEDYDNATDETEDDIMLTIYNELNSHLPLYPPLLTKYLI